MSRSERRREDVIQLPPPIHGSEPLSGLGVAKVPGSATKWFAYRCSTTGHVDVLTPLYGGKLKGERQESATGRLKLALLRTLGGLE